MTTQPAIPRIFRIMLIGIIFAMGMLSVSAQSSTSQVALIEIDGTITPAMASYVKSSISQAENNGAEAIVLRIDTPGGLSTAMDDIVTSILESEVPVIAWVGPGNARAASAGVYITYAAHIAAMAPGTNIGSASPVAGDGSEMTETMRNKVTNDAVARIRNLAELRGRNVDWAIAAVRDAENITATQALELGVIDLIAPNIETLLNEVDGTTITLDNGTEVTLATAGAGLDTIGMNAFERFLQLISDPTIAYLLLSFGSLGIFLELSNPGSMVPGIIGVVCFILGFYALGTLPVNWTGVALIALAFALFFIDLFVSSFGLLLVGGILAFVFGSYMLIDETVPGYGGVSRPVIWLSTGLVLASALVIGTLVLKTQRRAPRTGKKSMIGEIATVRSALAPSGMAGTALAGSAVRITDVHGIRLTVALTDEAEVNPVASTSRREALFPVT
jgi:membrane-bound serine protease (ClpP class)